MCELYAAQQLEIPSDESQWRSWAMGIKGIDSFSNQSIPEPGIYENWYDWAEALMNSVNPSVAVGV
jgi:hypothetical protein